MKAGLQWGLLKLRLRSLSAVQHETNVESELGATQQRSGMHMFDTDFTTA